MGCRQLNINDFFVLRDLQDIGRLSSVVCPLSSDSFASGTGKTGKVQSVTDTASNTTSFDYDESTGRRTKVTNALGKDTIYSYNARGQVVTVRGEPSYPLSYTYDSYAQMAELHTYRDDTNPLVPDITTWAYDAATGLLTSKTDAAGKAVSYTYDSANRLATRTWAREISTGNPPVVAPLATTYTYDGNTGELSGVDYSDSTPDISYTYNRLGQQKTVSDAVGTRTFTYNSALQPLTESISGLYSKLIERSYATTGPIGRYTGVNIGTEYEVEYGYDTLGRLSTLSSGSDTFTYAYLANSNLVGSITYPHGISVASAYEANRDLITSVENKHGSTVISKYDYANDQLGRRTSMAKSGTAFTASDTIFLSGSGYLNICFLS